LYVKTLFKNFKIDLAPGQGEIKLWYLTGTTAKEEVYVTLTPRNREEVKI